VLARLGSDGGKSVSRVLGRLRAEQVRPEMTRLDSNLTLHHSAPQNIYGGPGPPHPLWHVRRRKKVPSAATPASVTTNS